MRVSSYMAFILACLCAVSFSTDIHGTTMLPAESVAAGQSGGEGRVDTGQALAIWD